tara:strand:+ start:113 stop:277 length:165 start_codon:yes stop_codon:yes gene_type:complete
VSPAKITDIAIPIIAIYDANKPNFFLIEISLLNPKNNVMMKYGATNAFVKNERM